MKKLLLLLTVVLAVSLTACGENDASDNPNTDAPSSAQSESAAETPSGPINLCDGKLYGGMIESEAMTYLGCEPGITFSKYVDGEPFTHAFYIAEDWYGLGDTMIDLQSNNGTLKYVEFVFSETTSQDVLAEITNRFGSNYEVKKYSTYKKYTWSFSDAHATVMAYDEERDTVSFFVTYLSEKE